MLALHTADPDELRTKLRPDIMMVELQEHEQSIYQRAASSTTHSVLPSSVIDPRLGSGRQWKIWTCLLCWHKICRESGREKRTTWKAGRHAENVWIWCTPKTHAIGVCWHNLQLQSFNATRSWTAKNSGYRSTEETAYARIHIPTQHHQGKEIPREQWQICVAS